MWNQRYSEPGYAYGTEPNEFLKNQTHHLIDPVLSLAEGEGRNAVYLAQQGMQVTGVDLSDAGLGKAKKLAASRGVEIDTVIADLAEYYPEMEHYGSVIAFFAHFPRNLRRMIHHRVIKALKPGGVFMLEAFTPAQVDNPQGTGGPKDPNLCITLQSLKEDFAGFTILVGQEIERTGKPGKYHNGTACVVQFIARKPGASHAT